MLVQTFKDYLNETLGIQAQPVPWTNAKVLPFLLRDRYEFFSISLLNAKCLLMVPKSKAEETPAVVRKHREMVKEKWEGEVIFVPQNLSSFNRKRLIEQKVPFVVPGNQLYLPDMGMDLREHFKKPQVDQESLSPATQVIVLDTLVNGFNEALNVHQLAKKMGYSLMTITRALNEIGHKGLGLIQVQGRERKLKFDLPKKELWKKALPYLPNPIKMKSLSYDKNLKLGPDKVESGLYALAHYSDLAEPKEKSYALSSRQFNALKNKKELLYSNNESDQMAWLEVWRYDPTRFSKEGIVNPFPLYLSLRDDKDERVQQALEKMMENVHW